jgi:ankyrin repeat protein
MSSPVFQLPAHKVTPEWRGREVLDEVSKENPSFARVKKFIEAGTYLEVRNAKGETPLIAAIKNKQSDIALLLINSGANLGACDNENHNVFYHAVNTRNLDVLRPLFAMNAPEMCPTTHPIGMDRWDDYVSRLKEEIAKIDAGRPISVMKKLTLKR